MSKYVLVDDVRKALGNSLECLPTVDAPENQFVLKPCPICGSREIKSYAHNYTRPEKNKYKRVYAIEIECEECYYSMTTTCTPKDDLASLNEIIKLLKVAVNQWDEKYKKSIKEGLL